MAADFLLSARISRVPHDFVLVPSLDQRLAPSILRMNCLLICSAASMVEAAVSQSPRYGLASARSSVNLVQSVL